MKKLPRVAVVCAILFGMVLTGCGSMFRPVDLPADALDTPTETVEPGLPADTSVQPEIPSDTTADTSPAVIDPETYFDGALFIGDSLTEGLRQYVMQQRKMGTVLGTAKFLATTNGITLADLTGDRQAGLFYLYQGKERPLAEIVAEIAPVRVFLLLGLNDLAAADPVIADSIDRYGRVIDMIAQTVPAAEIVVIANPPKVASSWLPDYTANREMDNELIDEFVDALAALCGEREIPYVDAHAALSDEEGALPAEFCRDGYVHLSDAGAAKLTEELYLFAKAQMEKTEKETEK